MTIPGFIVRNALRNKRRLVLTVLSVALSLFLYTILQTALREMTQPAASEASAGASGETSERITPATCQHIRFSDASLRAIIPARWGLAALLAYPKLFTGRKVGIVLSGVCVVRPSAKAAKSKNSVAFSR